MLHGIWCLSLIWMTGICCPARYLLNDIARYMAAHTGVPSGEQVTKITRSGFDIPLEGDDITDPRLHPDGEADATGALAGNQSKDLSKCADLHNNRERSRCCTIARVQEQ